MNKENIIELDSESFQSTVSNAGSPVIVDFWAPWCGPCKAIAPMLEEIADEMGDNVKVAKVNVDNNSDIANQYKIRAIPTLLIFKDGELKDQLVGMMEKNELKEKIEAIA